MSKKSKKPTTEVRTFDEWKALGRCVERGQKSTGRNRAGECTFTKQQTKPLSTTRHPGVDEGCGDYDYDEEDLFCQEF